MNVNVSGDLAIESTETFFVNLSSPQNCTIGDAQGVGTIIDDDVTSAQFSAATMAVNEADGSVLVTVVHAGDLSQPFTALYSTASFVASERTDFNAAFGTLQFAAGEASKSFTIFITDDVLVESPERFFVILTGPNGQPTNSPSFLEITINSDDAGGSPTR